MNPRLKTALFGLGLIGVGGGLAVIGAAVVVPACIGFSRDLAQAAIRKGKEGVMCSIQSAAATVGEVTGKLHHTFETASRAGRGPAVQ